MKKVRITVLKTTLDAELAKECISPVTPMPEVRRAKFLVVFFCL